MFEEKSCLQAIGQGSEEALEQLYSHFGDRVFNTLLSYVKNKEDAEELLQDVFVTIYNTAVRFQFGSSVSTWIYRITVNKSLDFLRKKKSKKRSGIFTSLYVKDTGTIQYESPDFAHPGVQLEHKENAQLLFRAIETLSENQKTAFILTQIEGLPQKEVAAVMEKSQKSVESLIKRARLHLKQELAIVFSE